MSTKRKIEDYKVQKVAIHCSTKEEWDKIVDLLPSGRSVKRIHWQEDVNYGKSDTITIKGCGWSPKKYYDDNGYTIYPASDFLEEIKSISKKDLKEGEIYLYDNEHICVYPKGGSLSINGKNFNNEHTWIWNLDIKSTTDKQKDWLNKCIKANKFIPYDEAIRTFEKSFKFNIGDEIEAKPGGYYISDPKFFAESHKALFPSEKSEISGRITERTQAKGFNWYRCSYSNWITEEGVELIKEDVPEYIECIDTGYFISDCSSVNENNLKKGTIYKVSSKKPESIYSKKIVLEAEKGHIEIGCNDYQTLYKSSTKEAFDLQNSKTNTQYKIGKWYTHPKWSPNSFIKFSSIRDYNSVYELERISQGNYKGVNTNWSISYEHTLEEADMNIVSNFLPKNHPDKIKTPSTMNNCEYKVGDWVKIIQDGNGINSISQVYLNKIGKFIQKTDEKHPFIVRVPEHGNIHCLKIIPATLQEIESIVHTLTDEEILEVCKQFYPLGTKFRPAHIPNNNITNYYIITKDSIFHKNGDKIVLTINEEWWIDRRNLKYSNTNYNRVIYYQGKWAEIVSDGQGINTYGLKVGDTLKKEIINAWAGIEGNFCTYVQEGWVDTFCRYGEDRKIEDFRDIDGQIGFHVSGCTERTHYLKAEGFKEFADNFYKKEAKSWVQKQEEMLDDAIKQHPLTPTECYPSNEIIIPQVIKAQKTIQKITIESPTELDLKLKTIRPKQIQTIKI